MRVKQEITKGAYLALMKARACTLGVNHSKWKLVFWKLVNYSPCRANALTVTGMICRAIQAVRCVLCVMCSCGERIHRLCAGVYGSHSVYIFSVASTYASVGRVSRSPMCYASKCTHSTCLQGWQTPTRDAASPPLLRVTRVLPAAIVSQSINHPRREILIVPPRGRTFCRIPLGPYFGTLMQERDNPLPRYPVTSLLEWLFLRSFPYVGIISFGNW